MTMNQPTPMATTAGNVASGLKRTAASTGGSHEMKGPKNGIAWRMPDADAVTGRKSRPRTRLVTAAETPVELRGAGNCSRQVHNFGTPAALEADRFIVCEVLTPAGNWSSYPPHKHDEEKDGETQLEEIDYV